jgi:ATP adenylyltransferase
MEYIRVATAPDSDACFLCEKLAAGNDEASYILARTDVAFVILNAFPYNPGHLMVAPIRHVSELEDLAPEEMAESGELLQRCIGALKESSPPDGFNIGLNLGRVSGAGVPGHLHWHVVPRWNGDTNFMAVLADTKVLPEALAETYQRLKPFF